jgi:hypothetical protein
MNALFAALEQTAASTWMREAPYAYFVALIFHAWGMAFLVGGGIVVSLRVLGVARGAALQGFSRFLPVMWLGAALAIPSGCLLLIAYPAKALTNPVFPLKLACLLAAALLVRRLARTVFKAGITDDSLPPRSRMIAAAALLLWLAGVATGKLLLYTYSVLQVG